MEGLIRREQRYGQAISVGRHEITPVADRIEIGKTGFPLRMIWMKPKAVRVRLSDGRVETIAIPDPTRRIQIGLLSGALLAGIAMILRGRVG